MNYAEPAMQNPSFNTAIALRATAERLPHLGVRNLPTPPNIFFFSTDFLQLIFFCPKSSQSESLLTATWDGHADLWQTPVAMPEQIAA
jgi:hypothetical protein